MKPPTINQMAEWLAHFVAPDAVTEIRAFGGRGGARVGFFAGDRLRDMAKAALELSPGSRGVYFIPNPVKPSLLSRAPNRVVKAVDRDTPPSPGEAHTATDADIDRRRWLLIDIDPVKADKKGSATDAEREAAWDVLANVRTLLAAAGLGEPAVASSGNGWHACYPIDLPNSESARDSVQALLAGLGQRCDTPHAAVDRKTFNAARIWKLYGTAARKGDESDDRPHRVSFLHSTADLSAARNGTALLELLRTWKRQADQFERFTRQAGGSDKLARARAYLTKCPPAVSGSGGHNTTFHTVATVVQGFALSEEEGMDALKAWNATCLPPWSEKELRHKVRDAIRLMPPNSGYLLDRPREVAPATSLGAVPVESDPHESDDEVATVAHLDDRGIVWLWEGWIQRGVMVTVNGGEGCGKSRFCADLARRLWHGLPWPDGKPNPMPAGTKVMWVPCDGQHAELPSLCDLIGVPRHGVYLNARPGNEYGGTDFDEPEQVASLERRIRLAKPALVFIDTATNATSLEIGRPAESKKFFKPLYEMAARCDTTIVMVAHLNTGGRTLGIRGDGSSRQVITIDWEGDDRTGDTRKLAVTKSNSKKPPPLRVLAGGSVYEYQPYTDEEKAPDSTLKFTSAVRKAADWLLALLAVGEQQFQPTIQAWEAQGGNKNDLFTAVKFAESFGSVAVVKKGSAKYLVSKLVTSEGEAS